MFEEREGERERVSYTYLFVVFLFIVIESGTYIVYTSLIECTLSVLVMSVKCKHALIICYAV